MPFQFCFNLMANDLWNYIDFLFKLELGFC